jgi:hypothetical protein
MITTVSGVLLLVTLMLTLYLNQPTTSPAQQARDDVRKQLEAARKELADRTEALRERQLELMSLSNRVFVIPEADQSGKTPVLIVLSATNGWHTRLGRSNASPFALSSGPGVAPATLTNEINNLLAQWHPANERLVFYVRPSSIRNFEAFKIVADDIGFSIGYDAAEEEREYVLMTP